MAEDAPKRVLLKLSGEALMGDLPFGIDPAMLDTIAGELKAVQGMGIEVAIVVGAGNIFRGVTASATGMDRATADYAGMLATIIYAPAPRAAPAVAEPYIRLRASRAAVMWQGQDAGTSSSAIAAGSRLASALRAIEI